MIQKNYENDLRVGDEVCRYNEAFECNEYYVVTSTQLLRDHRSYYVKGLSSYGSGEYLDIQQIQKTGRHFDAIEQILQQLGQAARCSTLNDATSKHMKGLER